MPESLETRVTRWGFNLFPAFRGTGGRITYIARDWHEIHLKVPLSWRTRNYVGTIFGGSMYGAVDPIFMIMLIKILGPAYVVWDKAAAIRFRKPGRTTLYAKFLLEPATVDEIRREVAARGRVDRVLHVDLADATGVVHAAVDKTIYIKTKDEAER